MNPAIIERIGLLMKQGRYSEAKTIIENYLSENPDDFLGKYFYAVVLFNEGDPDKSLPIVEELLAENPEDPDILRLSIEHDIDRDRLKAAESKAELIIEMDPGDARAYLTMARIKMAQRSYDKCLEAVNKALELDAENVDALNLKIIVDGILGNKTTSSDVADALNMDAENPSTIANHGLDLLRQGKVKEALERMKYALSLDPNNMIAQIGMQEALKSRFWLYRLFRKYGEFSARLSAFGSWKLIIGAYIGYRILVNIAQKNEELEPYLMPIVYAIFGIFLLTWLMDPLMNVYLLTNRYGRVLLDKNEKLMARLSGISFAFSLLFFALYFSANSGFYLLMGVVFAIMIIPLGTFRKPTKPRNRQIMLAYTIALVVTGIFGAIFSTPLYYMFLVGLFIYQWVINGMLIKENARVFE